jgi:branched-chain amino acid aminotransferase
VKIYLDGRLVEREDAKVSVFDHGFLYGDGVFEGIRVYGGNVFRLEEHLDRLYESARSIALKIPLNRAELTQATLATVVASGKRDVYVRLVVSRGPGDLGIDPGKCPRPSVVIIADDIALYPAEMYAKGIALVTAAHRRIPADSLEPRVKSLNYLNNILAKIEARNAGCLEAVMLNHAGRVAECTADNLFVVKGGGVRTPSLVEGALGGITRGAVLELAGEKGMVAEETQLTLHDVYTADECFLTGTGAEIMPVVTVDGRAVGDGRPGPVTLALLEAFRDLRLRDGVRVEYAEAAAR